MIDLNHIKCAINGSDATNNIVNIFFYCIFKRVFGDTWIAPMQLMNILWEVDVKQWLERIKEFMEWLDWKMAKGKSHHIFPFAYDEVHEKLNYGQLITQAAVGQVMGFFRHWSILYRKPN
jgi:hypothetical protein